MARLGTFILAALIAPWFPWPWKPVPDLVVHGKSSYTIVIGQSCSPSEKHAAEELAKFIAEISGAALPIQNDSKTLAGPIVCVGQSKYTDALGISLDGLGKEGYIILSGKQVPNPERDSRGPRATVGLIIAGGRERGTLYGVYSYLEDYLDCRWFTPDCSRIPKQRTIRIGSLNSRYIPPLEYRSTDYPHTRDRDWAVRNKMNGTHYPNGPERGGNIKYGPFVHTFESLIPPREYFDKHPEYFSLVRGQRLKERSQLCLTNPDVVRLGKERLRQWIQRQPDATIFSVSQNDWHNYCECTTCTALAQREGSQSGPLLAFVNALAEDIEKDYPHVIVDTLAYQYTRKPPKTIRPRPNVCVRLCSIECCFIHPLASDEYNKTFRDDIEGWSKICNRLYIWDYVINYAHSIMPFPNFQVLKPNIQFFVQHGVKGIYEEACYFTLGSEMAELRAYVMAKLLWNPDYDADRAMKEFCNGYYEKAAPFILDYLRLMRDSALATTEHIRIYSPPTAKYLAPETLKKAEALFDKAEKAAAHNDVVLHRVEVARLPVIYTRIAQALRPRSDAEKLSRDHLLNLLDRFERIARRANITRVREGGPLAGMDAWLNSARETARKMK